MTKRKTYLPDSNVLVALATPSTVEQTGGGVVSKGASVFHLPQDSCWNRFRRSIDTNFGQAMFLILKMPATRVIGHRQVTDGYLALPGAQTPCVADHDGSAPTPVRRVRKLPV